MADDFKVVGTSNKAEFTLTVHRGEGAALLAMNWKSGQPPRNFVGFGIEYKEPGGKIYFALKNRLAFAGVDGTLNPAALSSLQSPIQMFRRVHFPRNADMAGKFAYRVTPLFMDDMNSLSSGEAQNVAIALSAQTYPGQLNVAFTRGFVSSQAFVDRYAPKGGKLTGLMPTTAGKALDFKPSVANADEALAWMGFEARQAILDVLDAAIADGKANVRMVAYDLNEPEVVTRLLQLKTRLRIIIDDEGVHGRATSPESVAARRLMASAGKANVRRQHMGQLQHNKSIVVDGPKAKLAVCGSTNFSWRGFFIQNNNAIVLTGAGPVQHFGDAFESYWAAKSPVDFENGGAAGWADLGLRGIDARVSFSPHATANAALPAIVGDIGTVKSSLLFSLAFLYQTKGPLRDTITALIKGGDRFVYGISDKAVAGIGKDGDKNSGIVVQKPSGDRAMVYPSVLGANLPPPFSREPTGGGGTRLHHKFLVLDFDTPDARVYMGSYNFSKVADLDNGENLLLIRDRRIATSYMIEALRIFDHYHFRLNQAAAETRKKSLTLARPPVRAKDDPWWAEYYKDPQKVRDREMFAR